MKRFFILILSIFTFFMLSGCGTEEDADNAQENGTAENSEKVEVDSEEEKKEKEDSDTAFNKEDFVVEITPTGVIDTAGGVEYTYNIQNNSSVPAREFNADIKFEFEDGQTMVDSINMYTTIMDGESIGDAETVYPEPASKIKSYEVIAYQLLDKEGKFHEVDLQLDTIDTSDYGMVNSVDDAPFKIEDFAIEITPSGKIDTAGGVEYTYNALNNAPIPAKEISYDVRFEFENGASMVDSIYIYDTLMNGSSVGDTETVYPEPASKIKSYQLIGYQITDKDDQVYDVDTRLNIVETFGY